MNSENHKDNLEQDDEFDEINGDYTEEERNNKQNETKDLENISDISNRVTEAKSNESEDVNGSANDLHLSQKKSEQKEDELDPNLNESLPKQDEEDDDINGPQALADEIFKNHSDDSQLDDQENQNNLENEQNQMENEQVVVNENVEALEEFDPNEENPAQIQKETESEKIMEEQRTSVQNYSAKNEQIEPSNYMTEEGKEQQVEERNRVESNFGAEITEEKEQSVRIEENNVPREEEEYVSKYEARFRARVQNRSEKKKPDEKTEEMPKKPEQQKKAEMEAEKTSSQKKVEDNASKTKLSEAKKLEAKRYSESLLKNEGQNTEQSVKPNYTHPFDDVPIRPMKANVQEFDDKKPDESISTEDPTVSDSIKPSGLITKTKVNRKPLNNKKPAVTKPTEGFDEDKPLATKGGYNISEEDRPVGGKGPYKIPNEEERPVEQLNSNNIPLEERPLQSSKTINSFDDVPIGGGGFKSGGMMISEYPEGMDPNEADQHASKEEETGPLEKRVKSKIVKTRQNAFEELAGLIEKADESDSIINEYAGEFIKFIAETNPAAQEKALCALKAYLSKVTSPNIDARGAVKVLFDKAIAPGKPNVKKVSNDVLCLFFEKLDKQALFDGINESIAAKNQKTSCAGVQAVVELLTNYGPRKLDFLKPFFSSIEKLAGSTVAPLRNEAMNFYKEALKWMGEAAKPFISKLKKQQVEDLDKFFEEWPKQPIKPLRGEEEQPIAISKGNKKGAEVDISGLDPYDIADQVDIFHKFTDSWCEKVLAQAKWSDKKQMLEDLVKAASVPKLAPTGHYHINAMLKRLLNDSNVNVMLTAMKIYGLLAKGLRKNFTSTAKSVAPLILQKFREKKTQVVDETYKTFDMLFYSISLDDIADDLKEALADKNAFAKVNILGLIDKYVERNAQAPEKCESLFKTMIGTLKTLLNDGDGSVRNSTMMTLGKLKTTLGDSVISSHLSDIDQSKLSKINDQAQKAEAMEEEKANISLNMSSINQSRPQSTRNHATQKLDTSIVKGGSSGSTLQRPQTSTNLKKAASAKNLVQANPNNTSVLGGLDTEVAGAITVEESEAKLAGLGVKDEILKGLESANWKEKQAALSSFGQWLNDNVDAIAYCPDVVIRFLKAKLKDWKESNLGINKETFAIISSMCNRKEINLNKRAFFYVSGLLVNNCQDSKFSETIYGIAHAFVEQVVPKYVINTLVNLAQDTKNTKPNPKMYVEICNILVKLLDELTVRFFPLKETIEYGKFLIANQNPQCRAAAMTLFKTLYSQVGAPMVDLINDIPPQTLKPLQTELEKVTVIKDLDSLLKIEFRGEVAQEVLKIVESNPLESLPRADISREADKIIKILSNSDWKIRKEGLEQLEQLLTSNNNRISPNGLHDLVSALKARLSDPNKALVRSFINFVAKFTGALGKDIQRYSKTLITPLISCLSDKQAQIRQEAQACLEKLGGEVGQDVIVTSALSSIAQESPEMRTEIINLALKHADCLFKVDIKSNIGGILTVIQDKNKEIRSNAEKLVEKCIGVVGASPFLTAVKDLKPAIQKDLKPIISKYGGDPESMTDLDTSMNAGSKKPDNRAGTKKPTVLSNANNSSILQASTPVHNQKGQAINLNSTLPSGSLNSKQSPRKALAGGSISNLQSSTGFTLTASTPTNQSKTNLNPNCIIIPTGQKEIRSEEEKKSKWYTDGLRDDLIERLKDHLKQNISSDLISKMFSYDFRKHIEAVSILKKALVLELFGTVDILDLIIRWIFIRLFDNTNIQSLKEIVDYVGSMVNTLEAENYVLLPFEAQVLLPSLIERLCIPNTPLKNAIAKIIVKSGTIYSVAGLIMLLLHGLNSKNPKVRIECLEVMVALAQVYGPQHFSLKDIKFFGKLLTHQDVNIKTSAMNLLVEIGRGKSDGLLQMLSDVPNKVLEQLQTRITSQESKVPVFQDSKDEIPEYQEKTEPPLYMNNTEIPLSQSLVMKVPSDKQTGVIQTTQIGGIKTNLTLETENTRHETKHNTQKSLTNLDDAQKQISKGHKSDEEIFDRSIYALINGSPSERLDSLLHIHDLATSENEDSKKLIKNKANTLIQALHTVLKMVFERSQAEIPMKFVQYFLNMSHKLCSIKNFLRNVNETNLNMYTEEMLNRLLLEDEGKNTENTENETIVKTLNSTMLRILENANPNDIFSVLFDLLIKYRRLYTYAKILGLIIKCILKLTKCLEQMLPSIQPERILLKSHLYLIEFANPSNAQSDDIGIKTIKTVLNELVKIYKEKIWEFYSVVQTHPVPDTYINLWIKVILRPLNNSNTVSPKPLSSGTQTDKRMLTPPHQQSAFTFATASIQQNFQADNTGDFQTISEISQLVENLKSTDNFEKGAQLLLEAVSRYPGPYFKGCTKSFVDSTMAALEKVNLQKNYLNGNELAGMIQASDSKSQLNTQPISLSKPRDLSENSALNKGTNLEEFHNKVNSLKMRYGLLKKDNNETQSQTSMSPIGANSGGKGFSSTNTNFNPAVSSSFDSKSAVGSGSGGTKTENILQKLNEMKVKMNGIVNRNNNPNP